MKNLNNCLLRSIVIIAITILLNGCVYSQMTHFTEDEKIWFSCYNAGDIVIFHSNYGHTDTLIVREVKNYDTKNPFIPNEGHGSIFEAVGLYSFIIKREVNFPDSIDGNFSTRKTTDNKLGFSSRFGLRFSKGYGEIHHAADHITTPTILSIDTLPGNYVVFNKFNSEYPDWVDLENKIIEFIFHKHYGLVYYKYENGEVFIRK